MNPPRASNLRGGERGFTLVELLVSLSILSLAAGMLLAGLDGAARFVAHGRATDARLDELSAAQALLRDRIERLQPTLRSDSAIAIVDARGVANAFDFVASPPDREQPDALRRYRLGLDSAGNLTLFDASILDERADRGGNALNGWARLVLLRGASGLTITYYGTDARGRRGWQSLWRDRPQPPDLVAIRVTFPPGDRRRWPDLLIRPRATTNAACRIDATTGRCEGQA